MNADAAAVKARGGAMAGEMADVMANPVRAATASVMLTRRQTTDDANRDNKRDTRRPDERRPAGAKSDGKPRKEQPPSQGVRAADETGEKRKPRPRPERDKSIVTEVAERVTMPEDIGPSPSIAAVGSLVTADSVAEAARTEGQEDRGRRRRRRRGRGGRSESGADAATTGNGNALTADRADDELHFSEVSVDETELDAAAPAASALVNEPLMETSALTVPSEPAHEGVAVTHITAVRIPPTVTAPTMIALPVVQQAPLQIDELQPVLQSAGLMLVQTAPERHAETQAKMASEPQPPRARRERPQLPPMDDAPLVQVETQRTSEERASV